MPESVESRVREVELDVARIGQRVEDHENDIRAFGPLVIEQATTRKDTSQLSLEVHSAHESIRRLEERFEAHVKEITGIRIARERRENEKDVKDRRYRVATWIAAVGMLLTFVSTTVGVIALVLQ
jgi:predicted  nucleic acid-binding Zn-ribbon protein